MRCWLPVIFYRPVASGRAEHHGRRRSRADAAHTECAGADNLFRWYRRRSRRVSRRDERLFRIARPYRRVRSAGSSELCPRPGRRQPLQTMGYFEEIIDDIIKVRRRRLDTGCDIPEDLLTLLLRALDPSTGRPITGRGEVEHPDLSFRGPRNHRRSAGLVGLSVVAGALLARTAARGSRPRTKGGSDGAGGTAGCHPHGGRGSAAALSPDRGAEPDVEPGRHARKPSDQAAIPDCDRTLCAASPSKPLGYPDTFDPSRFLPPAKAKIPRFAYLPVWRRPANLHRFVVRAAGSHDRSGHAGAAVEMRQSSPKPGYGPSRKSHCAPHMACRCRSCRDVACKMFVRPDLAGEGGNCNGG